MKQLDATNKALISVKDTLKNNSKLTIDYISQINKNVQEDEDISNLQAPELKNLQQCLNNLTQTVQTYSRI